MELEKDKWKTIPGFEDYAISRSGIVKRIKRGFNHLIGYIFRPKVDRGGYLALTLRSNKRAKYFHIHRLVALCFIGPPPSTSHQAAHNDGNKKNNDPSNLRWATPGENTRDRWKHDKFVNGCKGEKHGRSKLSNAQVCMMRYFFERGGTNFSRLGKQFGVTLSYARMICLGLIRKNDFYRQVHI